MAATGAISEHVRDIIPFTWAALHKSEDYGPEALQRRIDLVKAHLFGTPKAEDDEGEYNVLVQNFIAKWTVLDLVPAGIEYWMNASMSVTTQGHADAETVTYPDRVRALQDLATRLQGEVLRDRIELATLLAEEGRLVRTHGSYPRVSTTGPLVTPDPADFTPPDQGRIKDERITVRPWP